MTYRTATEETAVFNGDLTTIQPVELLEALKSFPFLSSYQLTFCCDQELGLGNYRSGPTICGSAELNPLCAKFCRETTEGAIQQALSENRPVVFRCHAGLLNFAVPLRIGELPFSCLIGSGVREREIDLAHVESLAGGESIDALSLLERIEGLPVVSHDEVTEAANKALELLPALLEKNLHSIVFEKTMQRISAITGVTAGIDDAGTICDVMSITSETLGILFDISRIAVLIADQTGASYRMEGVWGLPAALGTVPAAKVMTLFPRNSTASVVTLADELQALFPEIGAAKATCIRFSAAGRLLGMLVLFDSNLTPRDELLVQLVADRASAKLLQLQETERHARELAQATKLMTIFSALSHTDGKEALNDRILAMAADLVEASSGSLMFIDDNGGTLKIQSALGMNLRLAQSMVVQVGAGIAGKVAANGNPLLVNDIEKDKRVGIPNRPRFKTKSFVSIPLKLRDNIIGVLNLSDKKNQGIFTEADLKLLITFTDHASIMIERALSIERADLLEQLSITDPLTGLYNRRFLKKRMEEELARSIRQNLSLTVILIDLDNFKIYNDLCGHLAGDRALKRLAKILSDSARQMDVVTRYGGEEFCIILPGTSKKESIFVAERIRREIEHEEFPYEENLPQGRLTASVGVASYPDDGTSDTVLLKAADVALYRAKAEGRNRVVIAGSNDTQPATHLKTVGAPN
ncbi:diguanylate cyclase [Geotalea uraniireducens]|uniref:diguanylate cyclase n=1 Tax=Geotalea uraniireducens TaxID=351604 RepID=UPI00249243D9|nr:diguanylate cyclase [Geotalea uraniireducens]